MKYSIKICILLIIVLFNGCEKFSEWQEDRLEREYEKSREKLELKANKYAKSLKRNKSIMAKAKDSNQEKGDKVNLYFEVIDYDTDERLPLRKVEIKNVDTKKVYPYKVTDARGIVVFEVDSSERADYFSVRLVDDDLYEESEFNLSTTLQDNKLKDVSKKLYTPNNYQNEYAKIYFKAKIILVFSRTTLTIDKGIFQRFTEQLKQVHDIKTYEAKSGIPKDRQPQGEDRKKMNAPESGIYLGKKEPKAIFYYDTKSTHTKYGAIPRGDYYINLADIVESKNDIKSKEKNPFNIGKTWGKYYTKIYTDKECKNSIVNIETSDKGDIIKKEFYLYSVNKKGEFGSIGSIGVDEKMFIFLKDMLKQYTPKSQCIRLKVYHGHDYDGTKPRPQGTSHGIIMVCPTCDKTKEELEKERDDEFYEYE
ncbi:hypothetical protein DCO58_01650 [Helicobacter saguini]|uniref:Uncharacterized protein n=1 Tax=Helicobacter saguini TaxID=1548018 RepID=A0A099BB63_9HELI|nr:hypothetical protein [Helicobacter saguini]MWV62913.1 hypothetical protein [Helicobacter saguini]MWV66417.1 hypothetical protein [Helicobacter saguini]MWV68768.1 hypothetical protein [Helicobacter saguini]MWV71678.1 hypothetical protein [Helicobacter saguini]TLD94479.1 hypothetical protein LS64_006015 [Helicobacter saguini]